MELTWHWAVLSASVLAVLILKQVFQTEKKEGEKVTDHETQEGLADLLESKAAEAQQSHEAPSPEPDRSSVPSSTLHARLPPPDFHTSQPVHNPPPPQHVVHKSFFRVIIPARCKGLVIGRGGSKIKEIIKVSKVFVLPLPKEEPEFRLQGTPQAINKAFSMICQTLTGKGSVDGSWDCCKRNTTARGCTFEIGHDTKTRYPVLGNKAGCFTSETGHNSKTRYPDKAMVVTTKPKARPGKVFALDCEMVDTEIGKEVVIVTMLNFAGETCLESLVKPSARIMDYKTQYSGMTPEKLERATATLKDVQKSLLGLVSADDVLVGHSIDNDLRALHLEHRKVTEKKLHSSNLWSGCGHFQSLPTHRQVKALQVEGLGEVPSGPGDPNAGRRP